MIYEQEGEKTFALIFETGDEAMAGLVRFARENHLGGAYFTAIAHFRESTLGYFDWEKKDYVKIPVTEQVEVLSLIGDVVLKDGEPKVHAHAVRILDHLRATQMAGGHWPQDMWVSGETFLDGIQLGETAIPILLREALRRRGTRGMPTPRPTGRWPAGRPDTSSAPVRRASKTAGRTRAATPRSPWP